MAKAPKQGTVYVATKSFNVKHGANHKGPALKVKEGDRFWVTTSQHFFDIHGVFKLDRVKGGTLSSGWNFNLDQLYSLFEQEDD